VISNKLIHISGFLDTISALHNINYNKRSVTRFTTIKNRADKMSQEIPVGWNEEILLKTVLDSLDHPFFVINAQNYGVEMANKAASSVQLPSDITCYQLTHGKDQPCESAGHPCPLAEIKRTKKSVVMEHEHLDIEGRPRYVELHGHPVMDAEGNVTHMIEYTLDITDRKQAEKALGESEVRWRSLTETSPDHILMLDADLKIQFANFASPGLAMEELIGTHLYTLVDKEKQNEVKRILEGVLTTGEETEYETVYHLPDGGDIFYESHVSARRQSDRDEIVGLTLSARDITQRKEAQQELRNLAHELGERIKELNCLYGISKLINTLGYSLDEILQGTADLIPPSWQYPEITCARILLEEREFSTTNYCESLWNQTAEIIVNSERCGLVEVLYLDEKPKSDEGPFLKEERHLIDAIAELLGRTVEHMRAEDRAHHIEIQLAALEERERIGRELHDDLAQVIGSISTLSEAAQARLTGGNIKAVRSILDQLMQIAQDAHADVRHYILGIRTSSHTAAVRATEAYPSPDFFNVLEGYLEALRGRYGLETQVSLPDDWLDSPFATGVETQLLRIIQEALTNVCKHAGVNTARLLFTQHEDEVQVIITDGGCGFETARIFSESEETNTTQFGLRIMRERAESVGGYLEVRSKLDEGTSIIVHLPSTLPQKQVEMLGGARVLLVDDHPLYLEGLRSLLAARGFQVIGTAHDGLQAQSLARNLRPDLILMDVNMPRCDGLEATKHIKEELPDIKIIMLTVAAEGETLFKALKNGASGYLLKSLEGGQFFTLLANVLDGETALSPELASMVLAEFARSDTEPPSKIEEVVTLTGRQNEVLELTAQGLSNKEIANALHITEATVKYHVSQILKRLHLQSRYQLAHYARERGNALKSDRE
jgi:two-component system NarL family response regulator